MKVLDFTALIAGPTGGRILAEYGAEVIKINRPSIGYNQADPLSDDAFALFGHRTTGAGKKTIFLDLKSAEGRDIATTLIRGADIVHTIGTEESVLRLGLDQKGVGSINPSVIYSRVTAYARGGWRYGMRGHEDCAERVTGLAMRYGGGIPDEVHGTIVCDFGAGHFTALGVLLTVFDRLNRGADADEQLAVVEVSLTQTATYMQIPYMLAFPGAEWNEPAGRSARGWSTTNRLYQTSDGWIWIKASGDDPLASLVAATEVDLDPIDKPTEEGAVDAKLEVQFLSRPGREWERVLEESGIASHVYCDTHALMKDPIVKARGLIIERYHPALGWGREVGVIRRFRSRPNPAVSPAAAPGHHTLDVLRALNYSDEALDELLAKHVIATDAYQDERRDREQLPVLSR
jgi:crotonobetainyl-CoA:carnitine CoA-transferase CaiB-like acyl-CoA transferase